jgi:hypothetical protein
MPYRASQGRRDPPDYNTKVLEVEAVVSGVNRKWIPRSITD